MYGCRMYTVRVSKESPHRSICHPTSAVVVNSRLIGVTYVPYGWSQALHGTLRCGFSRSVWTQKSSFTNGYEFGLIRTAATQL